MNRADWAAIRHFKAEENWGNPGLMQAVLVSELDAFRDHLGIPIAVTCGTQGQHTDGSLHYVGRAVDIVVPDPGPRTIVDLWIEAARFGFTGIGLYRDWCYNGKQTGGLHLERAHVMGKRKFWLCVKENGAQVYLPFTLSNLTKYLLTGGLK